MAESRAQRISIVLTLVKREEDLAAQQLNACREQLALEQEQLKQLHSYSSQYQQDYSARRSGVYADQLINYSGFILRLETLCREQEAKIVKVNQTLDKFQSVWLQRYQKRKSIEDLIARYKNEENLQLEKRLQKELDELSSQQYQRSPGDS